MKIYQAVQVISGKQTTDRHTSDLISLLSFLESRLKGTVNLTETQKPYTLLLLLLLLQWGGSTSL
jgi:hypothetical protein